MIVVDGSALFAILLDEPDGPRCRSLIERERTLLMSAVSLTELLVVGAGKRVFEEVQGFLLALQPTILPVTEPRALGAAAAYRRWGKGFHAAGLNICDTFAYALAKEHGCPLLFVGDDFAKTDVRLATA